MDKRLSIATLGLSIVGLFTGGLVVLGAIGSEPASLKKPGAGIPVAN